MTTKQFIDILYECIEVDFPDGLVEKVAENENGLAILLTDKSQFFLSANKMTQRIIININK